MFLLSGCAQMIHIPYQSISEFTGTIHLKPTIPTSKTLVTVNEELIVDNAYVKSVTITGLPPGEHDIYYTSNSTYYKEKVEGKFSIKIPEDNGKTKIIQIPGYNNGYWALVAILAIALFIPMVVII